MKNRVIGWLEKFMTHFSSLERGKENPESEKQGPGSVGYDFSFQAVDNVSNEANFSFVI